MDGSGWKYHEGLRLFVPRSALEAAIEGEEEDVSDLLNEITFGVDSDDESDVNVVTIPSDTDTDSSSSGDGVPIEKLQQVFSKSGSSSSADDTRTNMECKPCESGVTIKQQQEKKLCPKCIRGFKASTVSMAFTFCM